MSLLLCGLVFLGHVHGYETVTVLHIVPSLTSEMITIHDKTRRADKQKEKKRGKATAKNEEAARGTQNWYHGAKIPVK